MTLVHADANDTDDVDDNIAHDETQRVMQRCHAGRSRARSAGKRLRIWREKTLREMRTRDFLRDTYMIALDAMVNANNPQLRYILTFEEARVMDEELWREHVVVCSENDTFHYLFEP